MNSVIFFFEAFSANIFPSFPAISLYSFAREEIKTIQQAQKVLKKEITRYNYHQVHSTTGEIPIIRFERAMKEKKSLFREFKIPSAYKSIKDVFCLRAKRKVDPYHKISIHNLKFRVHKAPLRGEVELHIAPDETTGLADIRIWYKDTLTDVYQVTFGKTKDWGDSSCFMG